MRGGYCTGISSRELDWICMIAYSLAGAESMSCIEMFGFVRKPDSHFFVLIYILSTNITGITCFFWKMGP